MTFTYYKYDYIHYIQTCHSCTQNELIKNDFKDINHNINSVKI